MFSYRPLKTKLFARTQEGLKFKPKSNRLVAIYYNQSPDPLDDSLPFYMFRKNADFHYPIIYFHPENKPVDLNFVSKFDVISRSLPETWFCSKVSYSYFITSKLFSSILEEIVPEAVFYLIFQSDSFLIQGGIESFMNCPFDYYGAVWEKGLIPGALWAPSNPSEVIKEAKYYSQINEVAVGNGGFSLRRISACKEVINRFNIQQLSYQQEDVFYCLFGQLTELRLAPLNLARRFSWEDPVAIGHYIGELKLGRPLGFHNIMADMAQLLIESSLNSNE
jgi:hypothetical protein